MWNIGEESGTELGRPFVLTFPHLVPPLTRSRLTRVLCPSPLSPQRYWLMSQRANSSFRPLRPLTPEEEEKPVMMLREHRDQVWSVTPRVTPARTDERLRQSPIPSTILSFLYFHSSLHTFPHTMFTPPPTPPCSALAPSSPRR